MLGILAMVAGLASFVCFIIVLIKQFQNGGVVHGIIGIITCGLWTLIWGWMNSGKLNLRNMMLIWTLLLIICIVLNVMSGGFSYRFGSMPTT
jgi:hypothetical protein